MTHWQKQFLGPIRSRACRACGKRVSASWHAFMEPALAVCGALVAGLLYPSWWCVVAFAGAWIAVIAIRAFCMTLDAESGG